MSPKSKSVVVPTLIRNSERGSFKRCRQQWYWGFVDLLKPEETGRALRFGDLVHQALAAYYKKGMKRGPRPDKTFLKLYNNQIEQLHMDRMNMKAEDEWLDAEDLGVSMLRGYYNEYHERDLDVKVISSEQTFQVPIKVHVPWPGDGYDMTVYVVGTLDGIWEQGGDIFFKEFKTAAAINLSPLPFDEQAGTYWTYAPRWMWKKKMLPEGVYPSHILYTFLRKAMKDQRPQNEAGLYLNQNGSVSKKQPSPYFARQPVYRDDDDRKNMHERVVSEAFEMELTRKGFLHPIKNPGPLYMSNCVSCSFRDMCELHETGADWEAMRDATMTTWDPYDAHEIIERH